MTSAYNKKVLLRHNALKNVKFTDTAIVAGYLETKTVSF